jgi:hypothetical protein
MNAQLPDDRLKKLARLVGAALTKRWMRVLNERQKKRSAAPNSDVPPRPGDSDFHGSNPAEDS